MTGDALLFYDGECRLCRRTVDVLRGWDRRGRIACLPFDHPAAAHALPDVPRRELEEAIVFVTPEGTRHRGADAVPRILALLPLLAPLRFLFALPGAREAARRVYRWVAGHRHELGCRLTEARAAAG
jgi:predicted DCC family thiol-disulfide oxidoreductase YuxK